MSILERLSRLIRANVNDLISRAEDPEKIINQALVDMRDAYQQARNEVATAMAESTKMEREQKSNEQLAMEFREKAEQALKAGREDLAREALKRKKNNDDLAAAFAQQLDQQRSILENLKTQLRALESKIDELESRKQLLAARQKTAQAGETLERVSGFDRARGAMDVIEEMERKVEGMEDRSAAKAQLRHEGDLSAQIDDLGREKEIDDELSELKRSLGQG